jgi:Skp family chaperone for outer membrane proteins
MTGSYIRRMTMRQSLLTANLLALLGLVAVMMATIGFGWRPIQAEESPKPAAEPQTSPPKIAVFNMAKVMKDYGKAKYHVAKLNEEKNKLTAELVQLRAENTKLQGELKKMQDPAKKKEMEANQLELARHIEDRDREITKILNDKASAVISSIYDDIKVVVDKMAEINGYDIVFAYPDAVSPEEASTPYIKELKLKPPAAQPFFVGKRVDVTDVIIQTVNTWYPPPSIP